MIKLSNGHILEFIVASGALGFDGHGYFWEWPLRWTRFIEPHLFTIVVKSLLPEYWPGNLRWYAPWRVLKFISHQGKVINPLLALMKPSRIGGTVNAIGLTGPGGEKWLKGDYPVIVRQGYTVIISIAISECGMGCVDFARNLNDLERVVALEFNASCPNARVDFTLPENAEAVIEICYEIKKVSKYPLILKLSCAQPYIRIAKETEGIVEAISINSVPWRTIFPARQSPLARYGGGGVSGKITQPLTWKMMEELSRETKIPVIGPSIWEYEDIDRLKKLGAKAVHFGTIFLPYPWKPALFVRRWLRENT